MASFNELLNSKKPVLVDFTASWCGPCKRMSPILEQLKKQLGDKTTILKVDVDKNQQTATAYQVQGVPTFIIFKEGKIMWRQSGVISLEELKMQLQKFE